MTPKELILAARTAAEKVYGTQFFNEEIEAAIALVLEEAAKVADEYQHRAMALYPHSKGIAAAIRAMKETA